MKAIDLRLDELVDFSEGRLNLKGRRLVLHDMHAFAQFRKDLLETAGWEHARRIFTRFGYFWGQADAAAMKRIFKWESLAEWLKAGPRLHTLQGVNRTVIKALDFDVATGRFLMELVWHDSGEAEEHLAEVGRAEQPICWMLAGYVSGYCSFCFGREVYFIESRCAAAGARACAATGKDVRSWGAELKPHLPFFQGDDIVGKVQRLTQELRRTTRELAEQRRLMGLAGGEAKPPLAEVRSESFRRVLDLAGRVAPFDSSVLIGGETGTGKEVLARLIHRRSHRASGPFVAVNCAALPETLLESELFGHKAGSFTGAVQDRVGLFEQAEKGTVFLDEIGDITPATQLKILRVLQEREILRVGESRPRPIDVRVIAATNRDLQEAMRQGQFREDLYYRLRVIEIDVPPLRERADDILPLAQYFVRQFAVRLKRQGLRLDAGCVDYLQRYAWPGNVRELENTIERAAVLCRDGTILPEHLPLHVVHAALAAPEQEGAAPASLADLEYRQIESVLRQTGGNRTRAAQILGISPITLWRKLKKGRTGPSAGMMRSRRAADRLPGR
jgi:two-component system, NtrC family, response regulator HydG